LIIDLTKSSHMIGLSALHGTKILRIKLWSQKLSV